MEIFTNQFLWTLGGAGNSVLLGGWGAPKCQIRGLFYKRGRGWTPSTCNALKLTSCYNRNLEMIPTLSLLQLIVFKFSKWESIELLKNLDLKHKVFWKIIRVSLCGYWSRVSRRYIQNPMKHQWWKFAKIKRLSAVDYFAKKLHHRCLIES